MHSKLVKAVADRRCKQIPLAVARGNGVTMVWQLGALTMGLPDGMNKKPPARITVAVESKILASREEAAQMLSISQRALDHLIATRRMPTRRIGGRVLIPVSELRKYARTDHPERIVA
jgi:excisionase family DNA binding protein